MVDRVDSKSIGSINSMQYLVILDYLWWKVLRRISTFINKNLSRLKWFRKLILPYLLSLKYIIIINTIIFVIIIITIFVVVVFVLDHRHKKYYKRCI